MVIEVLFADEHGPTAGKKLISKGLALCTAAPGFVRWNLSKWNPCPEAGQGMDQSDA